MLLIHPKNAQQPTLSPGLYFLNLFHLHQDLAYIIFWPEDTTWDDGAFGPVSSNRTTFIRYVVSWSRSNIPLGLTISRRFLTKLCDQVVALISDEHSKDLVFKSDTEQADAQSVGISDRFFPFEVHRQEGSAIASLGFKVMRTRHSDHSV
jgi:hypothetical protein